MSSNEKIKEQIGWFKVVFGLLVATVISLIGWMATHYKNAEVSIMLAAMIVVVVLVYAIIQVNITAFKKWMNWRICNGLDSYCQWIGFCGGDAVHRLSSS
jgi:cyanate permease